MLRLSIFAAALGLAGGAFAQVVYEPGLIQQLWASGLSQPVSTAFIGPGDVLVCEKATGRVRRVTNGVIGATALDLAVNSASERGLLGITLHPDFPAPPFVYLYYSASSTGTDTAVQANWTSNRVSRFQWNGATLFDETVLWSVASDVAQANGPNHDGGPLTFGPDGNLYFITGDLNRNRVEQNNAGALPATAAGSGGVHRLTDAGSVPSDNPFIAGPAAFRQYFAYGIRNSFGLAFDPVTGFLWASENGPGSYDEVNLVFSGFNSGWSDLMGPDSRDPDDTSGLAVLPGSAYADPKFSWNAVVAPTAVLIMDGVDVPAQLQNKVLVGANNTGAIYQLPLNVNRNGFVLAGGLADLVSDSVAERDSLRLADGLNVVTDLDQGPDGMLYVTSINGNIRRIRTTCTAPTIITQPVTARVRAGESANFAVATSLGTTSPVFQWRKDNVNLSNGVQGSGAVVAGATTPALSITGITDLDAGEYTCFVSNACGNATSAVADLYVCLFADSNGDGTITFDDIDCFINALVGEPTWLACGTTADDLLCANDCNRDGAVTFDDIDPVVLALIDGSCE